MSRGHPDDPAQPHILSGGNGDEFCLEVLKMTAVELVRRFELWATNKDSGVFFFISQTLH